MCRKSSPGLVPEFSDLPQEAKPVAKVALRRAVLRQGIWFGGGFWLAVVVTVCLVVFGWVNGEVATGGIELDSKDLFLLSIGWNVIVVGGYALAAVLFIVDIVNAVLWARESSFAYNHRFMQVSNGGLSRETVSFPRQKIQFGCTKSNPLQRRAGTDTLLATTAAGSGGTTTTLIDASHADAMAWLDWLKPAATSNPGKYGKVPPMSKIDDTANSKPAFLDFLRPKRESVTEDEIKDMVAENIELLEDEKRMINDILDLADMTVREIMKPRVDMIMAEDTEPARAALDRMRGTGYSRLPVYHEEVDEVIGLVSYKDLIGPLLDGRIEDPVAEFMYEPLYVPETKNVLKLLSELQEARMQMAIVVDEYGGTDGLITMEDIIEEIVGEIADETDNDRDLIVLVEPNQWRVDGRFPVEDAVELGWPVEESDDYETLAGWIIHELDSVPRVGDELLVDGYAFKVVKMRRSRISIVQVKKLPSASCEESVTTA